MPIIGYKKQFKNIEYLKNETFTINFKLKYSSNGALKVDNEKKTHFDCGDCTILLNKVFDDFNEQKLKEYDNGIQILSICKYLVDNIPDLYSITYESKESIDIYFKDEIINDYILVQKHFNNN